LFAGAVVFPFHVGAEGVQEEEENDKQVSCEFNVVEGEYGVGDGESDPEDHLAPSVLAVDGMVDPALFLDVEFFAQEALSKDGCSYHETDNDQDSS
jgi:hypothetical protein